MSIDKSVNSYMGNIFYPDGLSKNIAEKLYKVPKLLTLKTARELGKKDEEYWLVSAGGFNFYGINLGLTKHPVPLFSKLLPKEVFRAINSQRFDLKEEIPEKEKWYAMIGGKHPDKLLKPLKENQELFDGVKLGAWRENLNKKYFEKLEGIIELSREKSWPILIHCKCNDVNKKSELSQIMELAEKNSAVQFIASHLGGDFLKMQKPNNKFENIMKERAKDIENSPENLFFNDAVKDPEKFLKRLKKHFNDIYKKVVYATDYPFALPFPSETN